MTAGAFGTDPPPGLTPGGDWRLKTYRSLPSTSDLCRTLAAAGEPEGLAVLALSQTEGRGSRGRGWTSPPGNLALSVLLRPRGPAAEAGHWALLAAVALAGALSPLLADPAALTLKWPNDVLLDGAKLAGILIDAAGVDGRLDWLVLGFGVNLAHAPDIPGRATARLRATPPPEPAAFATILLQHLADWRRVRLLDGFAPIRAAWLARAQPIGTALRLSRGGAVVAGSFAGLADDGSLLLQSGGRVHAFATGDVMLAGEA